MTFLPLNQHNKDYGCYALKISINGQVKVVCPLQTRRAAVLTLVASDTWRTNAATSYWVARPAITTRANAVASFSVSALMKTYTSKLEHV